MKAWLEKHFVWILPVWAALFVLVSGEVGYWASDNGVINQMAAAAQSFGSSTALAYVHLFWAKLFRFLYLLTDHVNWFALVLLGCITWVFITLNHVFNTIRKARNENTVLSWIIFIVLWVINVYEALHPDFSNAVIFMLLASCVQFYYCDNPSWLQKVNMLMLLVGACAWRRDIFWITFFLCLPCILRYVEHPKQLLKKGLTIALAFFVVYSCMMGIQNKHAKHYEMDEHIEYCAAYSNLIDRKKLDTAIFEEEIKAAGLYANDIEMAWNWLLGDKTVFSRTNLKALSDALPINVRYTLSIPMVFLLMLQTKWNLLLGTLFLLVLLCIKKGRLEASLCMLMMYGVIAGFIVKQRVILRMVLPIYFVGICLLLLLLMENYNEKVVSFLQKKAVTVAACVGMCLAIAVTCGFAVSYVHTVQTKNEKQDEIQAKWQAYANENPEKILLSGAYGSPGISYRMWEKTEDSVVISSLGGWVFGHPYTKHKMERCGLGAYTEQSYHALLLPDVYFVSDDTVHAELIQNFFKEHYNMDVQWEVEDTVDKYYVMKIRQSTL